MTATRATAGSHPAARPVRQDASPVSPSFRSLYEDHFDFVTRCARRLGVTADAVDDVVQDIFIVVHTRLSTLQRPASLRSWLYGVVRRTVSTHHRARFTRKDGEARLAVAAKMSPRLQPSPLAQAALSEEVHLLRRLLALLHPAKREVLVLAELEGMTAPEIAAAVRLPVNTVYSRLRVARQELAELLAHGVVLQDTGKGNAKIDCGSRHFDALKPDLVSADALRSPAFAPIVATRSR